MSTSLVMTLIGLDRPGLVEDLARAVSDHEGSWESSRMARLGGCFAGILEVRVPDERAAELFRALHELEGRGLRVVVEDRPGMIADISGHLHSKGLNIKDMSVVKVREGETGSVRIAFGTREQALEALAELEKAGYPARLRE